MLAPACLFGAPAVASTRPRRLRWRVPRLDDGVRSRAGPWWSWRRSVPWRCRCQRCGSVPRPRWSAALSGLWCSWSWPPWRCRRGARPGGPPPCSPALVAGTAASWVLLPGALRQSAASSLAGAGVLAVAAGCDWARASACRSSSRRGTGGPPAPLPAGARGADRAGFEVVVVDDGSVDAVAVAAVARARHARAWSSRLAEDRPPPNLGAPRPAGAAVLTDDDCGRSRAGSTPSPVAARGAHVVAGPTVTAMTDNPYQSRRKTATNHLMDESCDDARGTAGFAPTSNVACLAEVWRAVPFDDRFPSAAGEDRDWCPPGRPRDRGRSSLRRCGTSRTSHSGRSGASRCATAGARPGSTGGMAARHRNGARPGRRPAGSPTAPWSARWSCSPRWRQVGGRHRRGAVTTTPSLTTAARLSARGAAGRPSPPCSRPTVRRRWPRCPPDRGVRSGLTGRDPPGTTSTQASPSVWLPDRPLRRHGA